MAAADNVAAVGAVSDKHEQYTFFWKSESPFSQWYSSKFTVDGILYNCAEQYMMHQKALLFGDEAIAAKIMNAQSPRAQKSLGRKVSNFNEKTWDENCCEIVRKGNIAKFTQHDKLWKAMHATEGTVLVEASPLDCIWGIGLAADHPDSQNKATWRGKNLLGYVLTDVREHLLREKGLTGSLENS